MPRADLFKHFGIFSAPGFLNAESCRRLVSELSASEHSPAEVYKDNYAREVDERARRTVRVSAPEAAASFLKARLAGLKSALEESFGRALGECEEPEFLVYRAGDFFRPHRDATPDGHVSEHLKRRRVSAVLFLNGQREEPAHGSFCGGSLVFYGLFKDPRAAQVGLPLAAEAGLLVAFPSELLHEVTPVTHGERYTVVTWFGDAEAVEHAKDTEI
jgi:SM-20-related protein